MSASKFEKTNIRFVEVTQCLLWRLFLNSKIARSDIDILPIGQYIGPSILIHLSRDLQLE